MIENLRSTAFNSGRFLYACKGQLLIFKMSFWFKGFENVCQKVFLLIVFIIRNITIYLKSVNSNFNLALRLPKPNHVKTHFLSPFGVTWT